MVEDVVEFSFANRVEHQSVLLTEQLLFLGVSGLCFAVLAGVGSGLLADAAATHEDLGLQQEFAFTRFALHVVDRVAVLHVGIEAENHREITLSEPGFRIAEAPDYTITKLSGHFHKMPGRSLDTVECKPII